MSALCVIEFDGKKLKYADLNSLANSIISNALLNKCAVFFNDDYAEQVLKPKSQKYTILVSYSFFDRNADELFDVTDFVYESEEKFKSCFLNKFRFLNQLLDTLFHYPVGDTSIYFTEYGEKNLDDYIDIKVQINEVIEKLYDVFIQNSKITGFSFPNIRMHVCY